MSRKIARKCIVCGKEYYYCPNCANDSSKPTWMFIFHDDNCREIYKIASGYIGNVYSKEIAKKMISKCDLSDKDNFENSVKNALSEILKDDNTTKNIDEHIAKDEDNKTPSKARNVRKKTE